MTASLASPDRPLRVVIVGGGIGGLSAACALRGPGHEVIVLEKSQLLREIGAAITIPPQARRIMAQWGFDHARARGMTSSGFAAYNANTGERVGDNKTPYLEKEYGYPNSTYHRVDLHTELRWLATGPLYGKGSPVKLRTGVHIADLDTDKGIVTLDSGETIYGDVIVGADGSHSFVRTKVLGKVIEPRNGGLASYRVLLPSSVVEADPQLSKVFTEHEHKTWSKKDRFMIMYWCRDRQILSINGIVPAELTQAVPNGWDIPSEPAELQGLFSDFKGPVPRVLSHAAQVGTWIVADLDPLDTWTKGQTIVIGDAAHPMYPYQAAGAAMAIEDAEALGAAFSSLQGVPSDPSYIARTLKQVETVRWERATTVQGRSRAAAQAYFEIPAGDNRFAKMFGDRNPISAVIDIYSYKGATAYAIEYGLEFPGVQTKIRL